MGLVQNLKRTLTNWADKILVELSCLYIKQVAKQTSRRQDNSLSTESLPNHLTQEDLPTTIATSSVGTSEKIIMMETEEIIWEIKSWALSRVGDIHEEAVKNQHDSGELDDAYAIYQEFAEWIEPQEEEVEIVSIDKITKDEYNNYIERD